MTEGALVLEGGSLRCLFTAGVLDIFMENNIEFSYVIGVSAGSLTGLSYVSKQIGRTAKVNINYINDKRYMGFRNLIRKRSIFDFDFLFEDIAEQLVPFDHQSFQASKQRYTAVATNCRTGKEEYFERGYCKDTYMASRASSSMPLLAPMVKIGRERYLDGGVAMPIAYQKAMKEGYEKVVLVLTREEGYEKVPHKNAMLKAFSRVYKQYPELIEKLNKMPEHYNEMQKEIDQLQKEGRIFVIRPESPVGVSRIEKDQGKLKKLYRRGRRTGEKMLPALYEYLAK